MKIHRILLLLPIFLYSGCATTKVADLKVTEKSGSLTLEKDYVAYFHRGFPTPVWLRGLKAGEYKLTLEDQYGYYFTPETNGGIILIKDERLKEYESSGKIADLDGYSDAYVEAYGAFGGLWVSKNGTEKIKLFYILDDQETESNTYGSLMADFAFAMAKANVQFLTGEDIIRLFEDLPINWE